MAADSQKIIPSPTGGINLRDPIYALPEQDARNLLNIFPDTSDVKVRSGSVKRASVLDDGTHNNFLATLIPYYDGLFHFQKVGAGLKFYEVEPISGTRYDRTGAAPIGGGALYGVRYTIFNGALIMVAADALPMDYVPTTLTVGGIGTSWSGPTLTDIVNVCSYKERLYFVTKASEFVGGLWYGGVESRGGALTQYPLDSLWTEKTSIAFAASTNGGLGFNNQELFVVVGQSGEVLVFSGSYPGSSTWSLIGRFRVPELHPNGFNSGFFIGSDLHIITTAGIYPLSNLLGDTTGESLTTTDKVSDFFITAGNDISYTAYPTGDVPVVSAVWNPRKKKVIINLAYPKA